MTYNRNSQYDKVKKLWKKIKRSDNLLKNISPKARLILSNVLYQIEKYGHAILTHYELSEITDTERRQNCNLIKQLADILDITFERSIVVNEKKYRDCYIFTKNENTDEILENPEEYFADLLDEDYPTSRKKLPDIAKKITRSFESPHIYNKKEIKNDNHDYQHNQFSTYKNFNSENIETKETKIIENSEINIANQEFVYTENEIENYEYAETPDYADVPIEVLEENIEYEPNPKEKGIAFVEKAESLNKTQTITSYYQNTEETVGRDGNTYQSPYLQDFRFTDHMINTAISRSNKKHYTSNKVWLIIRNILERKPDKLVYGGRQGVINYLVKAINGENDYKYKAQHPQTQEEKAQSMAEIQAEKQKAIDERYQMLLRGEVQSLSGAERYYG